MRQHELAEGETVAVTFQLPRHLVDWIDRQAHYLEISRSAFMRQMIAQLKRMTNGAEA